MYTRVWDIEVLLLEFQQQWVYNTQTTPQLSTTIHNEWITSAITLQRTSSLTGGNSGVMAFWSAATQHSSVAGASS